MGLVPQLLVAAPRMLVIGGIAAAVLALSSFFWLVRRVFGAPRKRKGPLGAMRALVVLLFSFVSACLATAALALGVALVGYHALFHRMRIAEIQCLELAPQQLRLFFVAIDPDGRRGPTETYDMSGDEWTVGGTILRWRPWVTMLGAPPMYSVTRVEGRWRLAADANRHQATAHDRGGGEGRAWFYLERDGARGPLAWIIDGVHGEAVSQLPDRLAVYDLYVAPDGYVLTKRSM
jgi:hypothetical protein